MNNKWRTGGFTIVKVSVLLGLLISWLAVRYLRFPLLLAVIVFFFVALLVYDRATASGSRPAKTYTVSLDDARQVVLNVLNEKGIPFSEAGDYRFLIENEVEIRLLPSAAKGVVSGYGRVSHPQKPGKPAALFSACAKSWMKRFALVGCRKVDQIDILPLFTPCR